MKVFSYPSFVNDSSRWPRAISSSTVGLKREEVAIINDDSLEVLAISMY